MPTFEIVDASLSEDEKYELTADFWAAEDEDDAVMCLRPTEETGVLEYCVRYFDGEISDRLFVGFAPTDDRTPGRKCVTVWSRVSARIVRMDLDGEDVCSSVRNGGRMSNCRGCAGCM